MDFEGSEVLEKIALIEKLDELYEAIDGDDFSQARQLMRLAGVSPEVITEVLKKMEEADRSDH